MREQVDFVGLANATFRASLDAVARQRAANHAGRPLHRRSWPLVAQVQPEPARSAAPGACRCPHAGSTACRIGPSGCKSGSGKMSPRRGRRRQTGSGRTRLGRVGLWKPRLQPASREEYALCPLARRARLSPIAIPSNVLATGNYVSGFAISGKEFWSEIWPPRSKHCFRAAAR